MEYQILLEMIEELEETPVPHCYGIHHTVSLGVLKDLQERIDKAREADIIAMSNEGCV
jgi:hypothetical protein